MADTNSIFYQIGLKVKGSVADATAELLSADNTWGDTNDFEGAVTVAYAGGTALDIKGTASTSDKLTAESLESTGDTDAKGDLSVTGSLTVSKDLTVEGDLVANGTEATVDADSLDVTDNILKLSDGASGGSYAKDSGLYFERGSGKPASAFVFDESEESFVVGTLEGSGGPDVAYGNSTIYQNSLDYVVNEQNQVTAIKLGDTYTSTSTSSNYTNYATALGLYFSSEYNPNNGTADRWQPQFSGGELVKLYNPRKPTWSATLSYDNYTPPTYSNADIANTTPAPLTIGSLKLVESTVVESLGAGVVSATFTTNASNQVTAIVYTGTNTGGALTYVAEGSSYSNTSVGLGGKKFTARYQEGTNYIDAVFSSGELVRLNHHGATLVSYDFSNVIEQELGNLDDFNAGYDA